MQETKRRFNLKAMGILCLVCFALTIAGATVNFVLLATGDGGDANLAAGAFCSISAVWQTWLMSTWAFR